MVYSDTFLRSWERAITISMSICHRFTCVHNFRFSFHEKCHFWPFEWKASIGHGHCALEWTVTEGMARMCQRIFLSIFQCHHIISIFYVGPCQKGNRRQRPNTVGQGVKIGAIGLMGNKGSKWFSIFNAVFGHFVGSKYEWWFGYVLSACDESIANGEFYGIGWYSIVVNLAEIRFLWISVFFCFWCVGALFIMKKNRSLRENCLCANRCARSYLASFIEPHTSGCSSPLLDHISFLYCKHQKKMDTAFHSLHTGRTKNRHARSQTSEIRARTHSTRNSCTRWILFYSLVSNAAALAALGSDECR